MYIPFYNMAVLKKFTYFSKENTLDCKGDQIGPIALFSPKGLRLSL